MRYYKKMLIQFLTIAAIFVLMLEIVFLASEVRARVASFQENMLANSRQLAEFTDLRIASGFQCSTLIKISDYTINYLKYAESVQYNRLKLYEYIRGVMGAAPVAQNYIAVSTFRENYVIRTDGTGFVSTFLNRFNMTSDELDFIIESFQPSFQSQTAMLPVLAPDGERNFIMVRYEPNIYYSPLFIFIYYTEKQFFDYTTLKEGDGFALFFGDKISAWAGDFTEAEFLATDAGIPLPGVVASHVPSTVPGFYYIYLTGSQSPITGSFWLILLLGLITLVCVIFIMVHLAKRMYLPIRELLTISGSDYVDDEFLYIKGAMLSMHSQMEKMTSSISQYNELIERTLYLDLLSGKMADSPVYSRFFPNSQQGPFVVVVLHYNQSGESQLELSQNMIYLLQQKIEQYLSPIICNLPFAKSVDIAFDTKALILTATNTTQLAEQLNEILLQAESEHMLDFTAAIGVSMERLQDISISYREAQKILQKEVERGAKVISAEDMPPVDRQTLYFPLDAEQNIYHAVTQGKEELWMNIINEIIGINENERDISAEQLAPLFSACVSKIAGALSIASDTFNFGHMIACDNYGDLRQKVKEILEVLSAKVQQQDDKKVNPAITQKMKQFIEENYLKDIGLSDLAEHLNLSKNYVSALFKNAIGSNFKDYLNHTRYRKACQLMKDNPNRKIKDIAQMVGCNKDILARLFIRYGGMLPSNYQETLKTEK